MTLPSTNGIPACSTVSPLLRRFKDAAYPTLYPSQQKDDNAVT